MNIGKIFSPLFIGLKLLRDGTLLKYTYEGKRVSITLSKEIETGLDNVVAVVWKEEVRK